MTHMRAYDRAGSGLVMGVENSNTIGGSNLEVEITSEQYLGGDRYLVEAAVYGTRHFDQMSMLAYMPNDTVYMEAVTVRNDGYAILDIWNTFVSSYALTARGDAAMLGGNDSITGNRYADRINAQAGNDTITGNAGNDYLAGSAGNDRLLGGSGTDTLSGGSGNDRLVGSSGADRLAGGSGADRFVFGNSNGTDSILDFQNGIDKIEVAGSTSSFRQIRVYDRGADAEIRFDNNVVTLKNIDHRIIDASDFVFV